VKHETQRAQWISSSTVCFNIDDFYNKSHHGATSIPEKLVDNVVVIGSVLKLLDLATIPGEPPEAN
jgi:hypothetical protein